MESRIARAKKDSDAFCELYDAYVQNTYRYVIFRVGTVAETEDLVSEIWEKALTKIQTLRNDSEEGFRAWLFKIARNAVNEHYRSKPKNSLPIEYAQQMCSDLDLLEQLKDREYYLALCEAFKSMPPLRAEVLRLHCFGEFRNPEIAALLNLSADAVSAHISRGLKQLRSYSKNLSALDHEPI